MPVHPDVLQVRKMLKTDSPLTAAETKTMLDLIEKCTGIRPVAPGKDSRSLPSNSQYAWASQIQDYLGPVVARGLQLYTSRADNEIIAAWPKP